MCSCEGVLGESSGEKRESNTISGDNGKRDPPVPIPNTEVKPLSADGTWLETARKSRSSPDSMRGCFVEIDRTLSFFAVIFLFRMICDHSL